MLSQAKCHQGPKSAFCLIQSSDCINSCLPAKDHFNLPNPEKVKKVGSDFSIAAVKVDIEVQKNFVSVVY